MGVKETLSERLLKLRNQRGMSQDAVAATLGVTRVSISHYERGERVPDADFIARLAKTMHVSADYLLGLSEYGTAENESFAKQLPLGDEALNFLKNIEWPISESVDLFLGNPLAQDFFNWVDCSARDKIWFEDDIDSITLQNWGISPSDNRSISAMMDVLRAGHLSRAVDILREISDAIHHKLELKTMGENNGID